MTNEFICSKCFLRTAGQPLAGGRCSACAEPVEIATQTKEMDFVCQHVNLQVKAATGCEPSTPLNVNIGLLIRCPDCGLHWKRDVTVAAGDRIIKEVSQSLALPPEVINPPVEQQPKQKLEQPADIIRCECKVCVARNSSRN